MKIGESVYIGDGVYVSFDGYQIWLAANDADNRVIALEPDVFFRLTQIGQSIYHEAYGGGVSPVEDS